MASVIEDHYIPNLTSFKKPSDILATHAYILHILSLNLINLQFILPRFTVSSCITNNPTFYGTDTPYNPNKF